MTMPMGASMPDGINMDMPDQQCENELCALLGGLSDDEVNELAALAEAMQADGGT